MDRMSFKSKICSVLLSMFLSLAAHAESVWLDVRTPEEKTENGIASDRLVPHTEVVARVQGFIDDKDTEIVLYCRSGRRAGIAKSLLEQAGYRNVRNAGSVENARRERGLDSASCC